MKTIKRLYLILPLMLAFCTGSGVELKFKFDPSQKVRYRILSQASSRTTTDNTTSSHNTRIEMVLSYSVIEQLANGDAKLEFRYEEINYSNSQSAAQNTDSLIKELQKMRINVTMSPSGEIADAEGYEQLPRFMAEDFNIFTLLLKALPVFPRAPIKRGGKWEREQEYPIENGLINGKMLVYKRFTLKDSIPADSKNEELIGTDISMRFDVPETEDFSIKQDGSEELGLNGRGEIKFNTQEGLVTDAKAAIFGRMIISMKHPVTQQPLLTKIDIAQSIQVTKL
ncbi:MAG: hypothetical protein JNL74_12975 [Fibrobacteres bacterium]|nr:hypothetical protein [Fibrobacterota bacterium]